MIKNKITYSNFSDWKFSVAKASGSLLWTKEGQRLIDFTSGWNVTNLGWNNEEIIEAANEQSNTNSYVPMWSSCDIQEKYAEALTSSLPTQLNSVIRATGGTEANEIAIKLARAYTKRKKIIGFKDTYHGQSLTVMSIGFRPEYTKAIDPMVPKFIQMEYPYAQSKNVEEQKDALDEFSKALEQLLSKRDVAGMILEPGMITGWGSCGIAPVGFLEKIRELTSKYGTLMILDEVGTGFSRIGSLFGFQLYNVVPDIITFAKGSCNGVGGIGTVVSSKDIIDPTISDANYTSTFGWSPVSCAAALKTLELHIKYKAWADSKLKGKIIVEEMQKSLKKYTDSVKVFGIGMEIGINFLDTNNKSKEVVVQEIVHNSLTNGLHIVNSGEGNIQIMPPINIETELMREGLEILKETISEVVQK